MAARMDPDKAEREGLRVALTPAPGVLLYMRIAIRRRV